MTCCQISQAECNTRIDYSNIIIEDRILPFVFELDLDLSVLNPSAGENQRFCYKVTGVGENISTYVSLSHWVLSLCPGITLEQITNIEVTIGDEKQTWGFPDKTDSPELGFLPNSQYYSKSHNSSFIKPLFAPSTFA